jgi:hypothetical protein
MIRFLLLVSCLVNSCLIYTISVDNSSLIDPLPNLQISKPSKYNSFIPGCYSLENGKKPNKIKVRVFPSFPLLRQVGGRKKLITHVSQMFSESNKIFINQLNVRLVPEIIIPRETDPRPINGGINVIGDLNLFGSFLINKSKVPANIFITNNYEGIVGAAYVGTLGSSNFNYAVSFNRDSVISHEILHLFGAQHTFNTGGVMSYSNRLINGILQMSTENKPQVCPILEYFFKNALNK